MVAKKQYCEQCGEQMFRLKGAQFCRKCARKRADDMNHQAHNRYQREYIKRKKKKEIDYKHSILTVWNGFVISHEFEGENIYNDWFDKWS